MNRVLPYFFSSVTTYLVGILRGPLTYSTGDDCVKLVLDLVVEIRNIKDKKSSYDQLLTYEEIVVHIQVSLKVYLASQE